MSAIENNELSFGYVVVISKMKTFMAKNNNSNDYLI